MLSFRASCGEICQLTTFKRRNATGRVLSRKHYLLGGSSPRPNCKGQVAHIFHLGCPMFFFFFLFYRVGGVLPGAEDGAYADRFPDRLHEAAC